MLRLSAASFSANLFFVLEWINNPVFTGSDGSFESECRMNYADRRLYLTELNFMS